MKVALYARVSTLEQAKEGYSLDAQIEKMQTYAKAMGYEIYDKYIDDGFTGKNIFRPALQNLINDIKLKKFNMVVIYKLDRLSRRVKDVLELVEMFETFDVSLFSLNENIDLSSPFGRATLKMSATFSELERETIVERMMMGKEQRAKTGYAMRNQNVLIGYDYDEKTKQFVPNFEAEQVEKIFELYLKGWNMARISDYMHHNYKNRYGSYNDRTSVNRVLKKPFYSGYFTYKGELYKGKNITPIISYDTWLKAQVLREKSKANNARHCSPYLLTSMIKCGTCGRPYVAKIYKQIINGKEYIRRAYGCSARVKFEKRYHKEKCNNIIIPQQDLDELIVESIKSLKFKNYKNLENLDISFLELKIAEEKSKLSRLLDLYENALIDKKELEARVEKINKEIEKQSEILKNEKDKLDFRPSLDVDKIKDKIEKWDYLSLEEKRTILQCLIKQIIIYEDETIKIEWLVE